jgi:hypothetical protein
VLLCTVFVIVFNGGSLDCQYTYPDKDTNS